MTAPNSASRDGFTLVEMLISLVISVVVMGASLSFAIATFRGSEANMLREEVYRNARFIGMAMERDMQSTGVGIESDIQFGTLSTFGDTIVALHIPWDPDYAHAYTIAPPFGTGPLPAGGTCGPYCIDLNKDSLGNFDLKPGDLARMQVNTERRVILVTAVQDMGSTVELKFLGNDKLLHYEAAFADGLLLDRSSTFVQKLQPIIYYPEGEILYRADRLDSNGDLLGFPIAYDVKSWEVKMIFLDLDEWDNADPNDADNTNDFDEILGVHIYATLGTRRADIRVAGGEIYTRDYEWKYLPRNLMYERNR